MAPAPSSERVRRVMQGNRNRDTGPEIALRRELHRRGFRFRLHRRIPPARTYADIVFPRQRVAVFVDGCFWHQCPLHFRPSTKNSAYWTAKITRNVSRDRLNDQLLKESGWTVVRIWEHEPSSEAANKIAKLLQAA
jgi:DNA mismatch endonuclease (patch repair protein)